MRRQEDMKLGRLIRLLNFKISSSSSSGSRHYDKVYLTIACRKQKDGKMAGMEFWNDVETSPQPIALLRVWSELIIEKRFSGDLFRNEFT